MTVRVVVTPEAEEHIRTIDTWWRGERPAAPDLFAEELAAAFGLLINAPLAGRRDRHATSLKGIIPQARSRKVREVLESPA